LQHSSPGINVRWKFLQENAFLEKSDRTIQGRPGVSDVLFMIMKSAANKTYRFNFIVNLLDGGFFGSALGFASFITVIPLFVDTMTDSAILIGLIPAIHSVGWQLPQLFTANRVARLRRYKPMVLLMSINERLPFFGLALVAWFMPSLGPRIALWMTFGLLVWQGLGGGFFCYRLAIPDRENHPRGPAWHLLWPSISLGQPVCQRCRRCSRVAVREAGLTAELRPMFPVCRPGDEYIVHFLILDP